MTSPDFQRARRPEHVSVRRSAILSATRALLEERPVAEISLRDVSGRVGLATSNVRRYFDSREGILLEILDDLWSAWLDDAEARLALAKRLSKRAYAAENRVATVLAESLGDHRVFCELVSVMTSVLERNISADFARTFKLKAAEHNSRLARMIRDKIPDLDVRASEFFAATCWIVVAGLWPYSNPTDVVAEVAAELGMPHARESFSSDLANILANQLVGSVRRSTR